MITVIYNNINGCPIGVGYARRVASAGARHENKIAGIVELNAVAEAAMRRLNRHYRGKDMITDVLSFAWKEEKKIKSDLLGQIYICYPQVARQAREYKVAVKEEFARMFAHGLLHLVGYDHERVKSAEKMFALQEKIVKSV